MSNTESRLLSYLDSCREKAETSLPELRDVFVSAFSFSNRSLYQVCGTSAGGAFERFTGQGSTFNEALADIKDRIHGNAASLRAEAAALIARAEKLEKGAA